jgi:hypothetical protein
MLTQEQLDDLRIKHGRIAHLIGKGGSWEVVLRRPTRIEVKKFRADAHNPASASSAQETLVRVIAVSPPAGPEFERLLDDWPGIPEAFPGPIQDLIGMTVEESGK